MGLSEHYSVISSGNWKLRLETWQRRWELEESEDSQMVCMQSLSLVALSIFTLTSKQNMNRNPNFVC